MNSLSRFERLALPHMNAAYNLAFLLMRSRPDAEDVVQEAYLRALRSFEGFYGEDIRPWLLTIVRHAAYRTLSRRGRAWNVVSLDEAFAGTSEERGEGRIATEAPSAEDRLIAASERDYIWRALAELPPVFREVLVLREIEGLSYRAIAEVTRAPTGTVMSRLSRGRGELRKVLRKLIAKDEPNAM
jgi:RNA polymerase sigma-70 factor, ECF subfamily